MLTINDADVAKRLSEYMKLNGYTANSLAKVVLIDSSNLSKMLKGEQKITDKTISKIVKALSINRDWLLTGNGNMTDKSVDDNVKMEKKRIPFYDDVATIGGTNSLVADVSKVGSVSEWIDAGDWFPEATAAIRHYGDSMVEYPSGSILALKRVEDWRLIIWGRNYCIETTEFRITKRLQDGGNDYIIAYSSNQMTNPDGTLIHSPIRIPKETIRNIDLVLGCVTKEYSNGPIKIKK